MVVWVATDVLERSLAGRYPESYDAQPPDALVYSGSRSLTSPVDGTPLDAGQLILSPTRTYAPIIRQVLQELRPKIHGMVHCSGGAQTKVLHFVEGKHIIKDNMFPIPPLFSLIQQESGTPWQEMYKVFNMGHRMELYVAPEDASRIIEISESFGVEARIIGRVEEAESNKLTIHSPYGILSYE